MTPYLFLGVLPVSTNKYNLIHKGLYLHVSQLQGVIMMPKITLHIEVVRSTNKSLSSMSELSARAIVEVLRRHYSDVTMTNVDTLSDLHALIARAPGAVFLGMNYVYDDTGLGAKIWVSDMLEKHAIRHTGSGKLSHRLGLNKHLAKQRMIERGLQTAAFQIVRRGDEQIMNIGSLAFPLFVKPSNKGGGQGIDEFSVVHTIEELQSKITSIHDVEEADALIETYLQGREFSVAVIGSTKTNTLTAMPIELSATKDSNGDRMLSNLVKKADTETVTAVTDLIEHAKLTAFAIDVFHALGARDYGRIDVRFDSTGAPHFLEANLIPSLINGYGSFPKAYEMNLGRTYEDMVLQILHLALDHEPKKALIANAN